MDHKGNSILFSEFIKAYFIRLPVILVMNILAGFIIALFLISFVPVDFYSLSFFSTGVAVWISVTVSFFCSLVSFYLRMNSLYLALFVNLTVAGLITVVDVLIIHFISNSISDEIRILSHFRFLLFPSLVLSFVMTAGHIMYEYKQKNHMENRSLESIHEKESGILFLRDENGYVKIDVSLIQYLTASKDKTVLHCEDTEYVLPELLGNVMKKLPSDFFRIHKSYAVRLSLIRRMEYYAGGRYMVFLDDGEQTSLICARSYVQKLKEKVGLAR